MIVIMPPAPSTSPVADFGFAETTVQRRWSVGQRSGFKADVSGVSLLTLRANSQIKINSTPVFWLGRQEREIRGPNCQPPNCPHAQRIEWGPAVTRARRPTMECTCPVADEVRTSVLLYSYFPFLKYWQKLFFQILLTQNHLQTCFALQKKKGRIIYFVF